ncbi:MAG TPA: ABC transporter permease [Vicinamibacterales bacterium]
MNALRHSLAMSSVLAANVRLLAAITRVELTKKFAGSVLGQVWLVLQPALLLAVYLFVYLVVFKVRFPGFSDIEYVLYVFAALVPFLGAIEAVNASVLSIKANMHLVKNVMLPIELVPVRTVLVALSGESIGLALVTLLAAFNGELGPMLAALPVAVLLQAVALFGVAWIVAGLGVALPDTSYIISLLMFLLMFLSPIAFEPAMVPEALRFIVYGNPVYYMLEVFRDCLIAGRTVDLRIWGIHAVMSAILYLIGAAFFRHFKSVLVDYE